MVFQSTLRLTHVPDKTLQFYKQSSIGRAASGAAPLTRGASFEIAREAELTKSPQSRVSPEVASKKATATQQEAQMDRMQIWRKNVESES